MARGKFISDFERTVIRVGFANGIDGPSIARFLGRTKGVIYAQRDKMTEAGTMDDLPLPFVTEELVRAMRNV